MKRVIFFVVLIFSSNNIFSQRVPSIDELMKLFEENKYTCSFTPTAERIPIDYEELYSIYGYDVEDDVSELRKAIDDFCECYLPKYYDEFDKINIELIRLIKNLKENGFEDFQFTSVLAKQVFINLGIIPSELEFKTFPLNVIEEFKLYGFGAIDTIDGKTSGEKYFRGGKSHREPEPWFDLPRPLWYGQSNLVGYSVIQEHDLSKSLDEFKEGDKTVTKIFFGSKDDLVKSIYYELVFQKLDNYREWVISDWEKKVICEHRKNTCGECIDRPINIDPAYVIATNVNIRNKPNVNESKVLFQLNKVVWNKNLNSPDSLMSDWLSYPPTPVEIIDSTVTNGNKWYKIKGAKLTKKEIDDLSRWGDWDRVRGSLFNLNDMGNKILKDNSNREHWVYHTLIHRFQNDSFKDGKYTASKVVEDWTKEFIEYINFTIDGNNVKGEIGSTNSMYGNLRCDIYGEKSADGKHLNLKSTCYGEGTEYEGYTYKITLMDNNAFKVDFTSTKGNNGFSFYRYEFEEKENKYLVTNNNFGLINSKTTINDLKTIFGEDNVKVFDRQSCDGNPYRSYYVETEDIEFYINDYLLGNREIVSSNKKFQTKDGLGVGSNKTDIEKYNGQSIDICWDNDDEYYSDCYCDGQVQSYNGGVFDEGIGIPSIDFEFGYDNKDVVVKKIKLYLSR